VARRPRPAAIAPIAWRDGVHLTGTPIWCDARRRRDVCFVSSADRVGRVGHGQLIGTPITLALLGAGAGHLAVPVRQRFTLGTVRLELVPSGRGLGAAALFAELAGRRVLYAGAIRTRDAAELADVRTCDAVVVAAPIAGRLPRLAQAAGRVATWTRAQLAAGRRAVLAVESALDGLEVAARLAADGIPIAGSRSLRDAAARAGTLATVPPIRAPGREPCAIVRVDGDRARGAEPVVTARVSLRDDSTDHDAAFAWPFAADRTQLLAWIEETGARDVYVTGPCAESIAASVGARAHVLGPPRQMTLFPREAAR
jgi:putative mRNA 3-end processing factor